MPAPWAQGARIRIVGRLHNQLTINVLHFATNEVVLDAPNAREIQLRNLAIAVRDCILSTLLEFVTVDWVPQAVEVNQIAPELNDVFTEAIPPQNVAEGAAQGVTFASTLVSVRTGSGGRKGRGRMFLPPGGEDVANNGQWDPAFLALVAAFCACMAGKFIGANATTVWRLGVLSRKDMGTPMVPANFDNAFREAISLTPEPIVAVMGTRKVGRGA